jgi:hypothetical protein
MVLGLERDRLIRRQPGVARSIEILVPHKTCQFTTALCTPTVCDIFQNEGAPENIAASIVGHKVKTLSYGPYAGAPALATKEEVMKLLRYPSS